MKHRPCRLLSLLLAAALLTAILGLPAYAADQDYREHREPPRIPLEITFTETEVSISSRDNTLRGILTMPKDTTDPVPVAVLLHGLATDRRWCDDLAWALADNGIASVRFDYAGSGESDGTQEEMTVSSELWDTGAMLDYVEAQSWANLDNIFFVGKSMGGVNAMLVAQNRVDEVKAVCLWYPGFGIGDTTRHGFFLGQFFFPRFPPPVLEVAGYRFGREFLREAQELEVASACRKYTNPVLILQGDQDFIAPLFYTLDLLEEFPDCTLHVIPGGGHGFWGLQELEALDAMVTFFREQIEQP